MNPLTRLVADTLAAPLDAARRHAAAGGRVVGHWSANVPTELLLGAGAFPLHLPWFPAGATPLADRYVEPLFDRGLRAAFEQWLGGALDFLDAIVLPRSLDSAQRIYYYAEELRRTGLLRGPAVHLYDVQQIPRASSADFTLRRTRELAAALGVSASDLARAVRGMNRRRRLFARLAQRQREGRLPEPSFAAAALRAAQFAPFDAFDAALEAWLESAPGDVLPAWTRGVVLAGSAPPDEALHRAVGAGGGMVLAEAHLGAAHRHGPELDETADPLEAIAHAQHALVPSMRRFGLALGQAVQLARECGAGGAVLWLTEEDEAYAWQVPAALQAADVAGLKVLALTRQAWQPEAATTERIAEFVRREIGR